MLDCTWNNPGIDKFVFTPAAIEIALSHYPQIPESIRRTFAWQIENNYFDDMAIIERDKITAGYGVAGGLRDMHYGNAKMCKGLVVRNKWAPDHTEIAFIYHAGIYSVAVPRACGNIALIDYVPNDGVRIPRWAQAPKFNSPTTIPEPGSMLLVATAVVAMLKFGRKKA